MNEEELQALFDSRFEAEKKVDISLIFLANVYKRLIFKWFVFGYNSSKEVR